VNEYDAMGEFHDLFMDEPWQRLRPVLATTFGGLGPTARVLDLGAGTGVGTRLLARVTAARITAVEPSRTMRTALTMRVADDPYLTARVTVVDGRAPDVFDSLAGPVDGFVCAHMLGHLMPAARQATFVRLAASLTPAAAGVVTLSPEETGDDQVDPEAVEESRQIGDHRYVARYPPSPDGRTHVSEYEVRDGDRVVRRERVSGPWQPLTASALREELAAAGLTLEPHGSGAAVLRRAGGLHS
jgi:SAM-dependent methyltransferase